MKATCRRRRRNFMAYYVLIILYNASYCISVTPVYTADLYLYTR